MKTSQKAKSEQCLQRRKQNRQHLRWYALDQACADCFWSIRKREQGWPSNQGLTNCPGKKPIGKLEHLAGDLRWRVFRGNRRHVDEVV